MGPSQESDVSARDAIRAYTLILLAGWFFVLAVSLAWNIRTMKDAHVERARLQAGLAIGDDAYYRKWLSDSMAGRSSASGRSTPANPHFIIRKVQELRHRSQDYAERRHLVGFDGPFCDAWEKAALAGFQRGDQEAGGPVEFGGVQYFRLMRPLYAEASCLKCHARFKPGKLCGAFVAAVATAPLWAIQRRRIRSEILTHAVLGGFALAVILFGYLRLRGDMDKIRVLKGILPICASCKNIRDESGDWQQLESYIRDHSQAIFNHGLCLTCFEKRYPEYYKDAGKIK